MEKLLICLLCLLMLTGCGAETKNTPIQTDVPTTADETQKPILEEETQKPISEAEVQSPGIAHREGTPITLGSIDWVHYLATGWSLADTSYEDNLLLESTVIKNGEVAATLRWDGQVFTITDADGERTYQYLSYQSSTRLEQFGVDFAEYYVLSNEPINELDANVEIATYSDGELFLKDVSSVEYSPTPSATVSEDSVEVVYADYMSFDRAECFGTVPEDAELLQKLANAGFSLGGETMFSVEDGVLYRYNYDFEIISETEFDGYGINAYDLENGGFLRLCNGESRQLNDGIWEDTLAELMCYNASGELLWCYTFEYADDCVRQIIEHNGVIYTFGEIETPETDREGVYSPTDVLICKFSLEGELLQSEVFGGSDYDSFHYAEEIDGQLVFYGDTQSENGDLLLSPDGYPVYYRGILSDDLEITDMRADATRPYWFDICGYLDGETLLDNDPMLEPNETDNLPEDTYVLRVLPSEEGYIVIRSHSLDIWELNPGWRNALSYYMELIYTGYSSDGTALWQSTGEIYVQ